MSLTSGGGGSCLGPFAVPPGADALPLSAEQTAVALTVINWGTRSIVCSEDPTLRHYIAGIVVGAALREPPVSVWVYRLAKQIVKEVPEEADAQDAHAKVDALRSHIDIMETRGDVTTHIDQNRRRVIEATPRLIRDVRRAVERQVQVMRAMVLAVDWLEEPPDGKTAADLPN